MSTLTKVIAVFLLGLAVALAVVAYRLVTAPAPTMAVPDIPAPVVEKLVVQQPAQPVYDVVVAKRDLEPGETLEVDKLELRQWSQVPEQAFTMPDELEGQVLRMPVARGEVILSSVLARGLATYLEPDFRALSIPVDDVAGVAGTITPGDTVDVFFTLNKDRDQVGDTQARLLLPAVQVLAWGDQSVDGPLRSVDESPRRNETRAVRTAILAVPLEDVSETLLAMRSGSLQLVLRAPEDSGRPDRELFPEPAPVLAASAQLDAGQQEALKEASNRAYAGARLSGLAGAELQHDVASAPQPSSGSGSGRRMEVIRGGHVQSIPY